jgi:hypothetical protein
MPAYFFRSEPGSAELRRLARGESGRVCQRVLMIANMLEGMEHEEAARLAGLSRSAGPCCTDRSLGAEDRTVYQGPVSDPGQPPCHSKRTKIAVITSRSSGTE